MPNESHDEFLELCAISTSGQLRQGDQNRLQEHLAVCSACREALKQYEAVVDGAIPMLAPGESLNVDPGPGWSQSRAEKIFFERLAQQEKRKQTAQSNHDRPRTPFSQVPPVSTESTWRHVWLLYAAAILLFVTLGLSVYWMSRHRSDLAVRATRPVENIDMPSSSGTQATLEEQLSDAAHERELARNEIAQRDRALIDLRYRLERQTAELNQLKAAQERLEADLRGDEASKQDLTRQREDLTEKLRASQDSAQTLQQRLTSFEEQSSHDSARAKILQTKVDDLTRQLQDHEGTIDQQEQLLAHDRDIRDLIGARDLYIAEVYDVADNGATKKPYGRVFYTKGKSLIFYAYDLDQQDGLKRATSFQAWGRRGPERQHALSLGIFSEDNISKKRWVLKFDDPQTLAQIDAVFVTVEPSGGSHKPSGNPLLFAYLKAGPNHP